jgi:hypothetical protein
MAPDDRPQRRRTGSPQSQRIQIARGKKIEENKARPRALAAIGPSATRSK